MAEKEVNFYSRTVTTGSGPSGFSDDSHTVLLLKFDNNQPLLDSSHQNHAMAASGTVNVSSVSMKCGDSSFRTLGYGLSSITTGDSDDWWFRVGDFTIEGWIKSDNDWTNGSSMELFRQNSNAPFGTVVGANVSSAGVSRVTFGYTVNGIGSSEKYFTYSSGFKANTWYHIAFVRNNYNAGSGTSDITAYVNGVSLGTQQISGSLNNDAFGIAVGGGGSNLLGYMDEIRVSKGIARYTGNFTVDPDEYGQVDQPLSLYSRSVDSVEQELDLYSRTV